MEQQHRLLNFRHRRSPSSDRFLGLSSPSKLGPAPLGTNDTYIADDELNEDDVIWTSDFPEPKRPPFPSSDKSDLGSPFRRSEKFGILAALPEDRQDLRRHLLYRNTSLSPSSMKAYQKVINSDSNSVSISLSRAIPSIPRQQEYTGYSQSVPVRKFQQSAPVNVPMRPSKAKNGSLADVDLDDYHADDEMMSPHEIVARGLTATSPKTTFSMLEGAGRTLKGRDLRQVRNAVWRQTGFLD